MVYTLKPCDQFISVISPSRGWVSRVSGTFYSIGAGPTKGGVWLGHNINNSSGANYSAFTSYYTVAPTITRLGYFNGTLPANMTQYLPGGGNQSIGPLKRCLVNLTADHSDLQSGALDSNILAFANSWTSVHTATPTAWCGISWYFEANSGPKETKASWIQDCQYLGALLWSNTATRNFVVPAPIIVAHQNAGHSFAAAGVVDDGWYPTFSSMGNANAVMVVDNYGNPRKDSNRGSAPAFATGLDSGYPPVDNVVDDWYNSMGQFGWLDSPGHTGIGEWSAPLRNFDTGTGNGGGTSDPTAAQSKYMEAYYLYLQGLDVPPRFACAWETLGVGSGQWDQDWMSATKTIMKPYYIASDAAG